MLCDRLTIIGVGLIGGSFGAALRNVSEVREVVGYGRNSFNLERAVERGLIDRWSTSLSEAVDGANVVMIATPVGAMPALFDELARLLPLSSVITDAGSVKRRVIESAQTAFGSSAVRFVPGHPIAGLEKSGVEAATANLFKGHKVILTPNDQTKTEAVTLVSALWQAVDAQLMKMSPEQHDELLAATSHLPHILAYALVNLLADQGRSGNECYELAAGGFYDISRIASSDPIMWRDICLENGDKILDRITEYTEMMDRLAMLIRAKDSIGLEEMFRRARATRERIADQKKVSSTR